MANSPFLSQAILTSFSRDADEAALGMERIKEMVQNGANINELDDKGNSALRYALDIAGPVSNFGYEQPTGAREVVKFLASQGAELVRDYETIPYKPEQLLGNTLPYVSDLQKEKVPFESAALRSTEALTAWIDKGGDPNVRDFNGTTPLMRVATTAKYYGEDVAMANAELLIKSGADVNMQDKDGNTALTFASRVGSSAMTQILLDNKADLTLTNNDGHTAADAARQSFESIQANLLRVQSLELKSDAPHSFDFSRELGAHI
ncbi:MAG: ankyrin repeat domain-containing protein [Actinomycetaceae bacterium]|nr:ankyrin repeat domain-containing protein [Actinomycetaceae bacterium]